MRGKVVVVYKVTSTRALVADERSHRQRDMCALLQTRLGPSAGPGCAVRLELVITRVRIRRLTRAKTDEFKREARECKQCGSWGKRVDPF